MSRRYRRGYQDYDDDGRVGWLPARGRPSRSPILRFYLRPVVQIVQLAAVVTIIFVTITQFDSTPSFPPDPPQRCVDTNTGKVVPGTVCNLIEQDNKAAGAHYVWYQGGTGMNVGDVAQGGITSPLDNYGPDSGTG
jgi:hypothetical protein